ncbi:MAG: 5'-methylthioadenosine/adenosylhomocysteine nucleosidase [Oscillospiraceae bacterium]|nr:5'-methylthioadenosine/adenosylhomocysteine nucleosidase [Oscillospiraceae bacterium]
MVWGIIGAMPSEIALLETQMSDVKKETVSGLTYQAGVLQGKSVVLCCSEIGKVNAAMCAQTLALRYGVDYMINTGVAGCTCNDLGVLDIVLSRDLVFHDYDWKLQEKYHPHTSSFLGDPYLIALAQQSLEQMADRKFQYKLGRIATGDIFVEDEALRNSIIERTHPDCVEMEGAAIALVAYSNRIPCLVIRSMSDNANGDAGMSFDTFEKIAADHSAQLLLAMLKLAE